MSKSKEPDKPYTGQLFEVNDPVLILRPCLWSQCSGIVKSVNPATGIHRIFIEAKDGKDYPSGFTADVPGNQLDIHI